MLPALPLFVEVLRKCAPLFVLLGHVFFLDEIPLMNIVEVIQEEFHVPCFLGQNEPALVLCHIVTIHKLLECSSCDWIALNIPQCKRHVRLLYASKELIASRPRWRRQRG